MRDDENLFHQYSSQLSSNDPKKAIEAAHSLGDLGDRRAVPLLINLLNNTNNPAIRDAAAVGLRELEDERALEPLVSLISDPKTEGHRGTLIYALEAFDCAPILPMLVDLVIAGNFEVSHQAFLVIEDAIQPGVDPLVLESCITKVHEAISRSEEEKARVLEDLVELLEVLR